ncbi:MAG: ABC transporter permease [Verrucomicrobiota bacterium]
MDNILTIFKREFLGYFRSPVAYVFLIVFLLASVGLSWFVGGFFDSNEAGLTPLFSFFPWVFVVFIPAVGMRLWAEEKKYGTWELLFTLPISPAQAVIGKFLAAWIFLIVAVSLTLTMVITVSVLGDPDWGLILSGYIAAFLMAGAYLSICSLMSALTNNQVIAFVLGLITCLIIVLAGWSIFNNMISFLPTLLLDTIANFSFIPHYYDATQGVITFNSFIYFVTITAFALLVNIVVLER